MGPPGDGQYGFDKWPRAARAVTADYAQRGNPLRPAAELDHTPDLHLFSQPRAAGFPHRAAGIPPRTRGSRFGGWTG